MTTKTSSMLLVLGSTVLTTIAQFMYKAGAHNLPILLTNWQLILGLFLYGISAIILIYALKNGEISVLLPIIATSYIWVSLFSTIINHEPMNILKGIGVLAIAIGVSFIGFGSKKTDMHQTEVM